MVQQSSGQLVTGVANLDNNTFTIPNRVYTRNLLSNFRSADPGYFSLNEGNPLLPADPLPAATDLLWDFLPMTVEQSISNLFYWDGLDDGQNGLDADDVDFSRPDDTNLKVINNGTFTADGSDQMVSGGLVATTAFDGSIHKHPAFRVETLDATPPAEGVYLVSKQVRMEGIATSEPFFIAFRTSTIGNDSLVAAADWIETHIPMLTSPPTLIGDFNGDSMVNIADYPLWRDHLGDVDESEINFNGDGDNVAVSDYSLWHSHFGNFSPALGNTAKSATAIPEPNTATLVLLAAAITTCRRCRRRTNLSNVRHRAMEKCTPPAIGNGQA